MVDLVGEIAKAEDTEIEKLLKAVRDRYAVLYPDWEVCTFFLQKSQDRNEQIDRIIAIMQNFKK